MKTTFSKCSFLMLCILLFVACKETPKEKTDPVEVSAVEEGVTGTYNSYKPDTEKSTFSTAKDTLVISVPFKSENLEIHEAVDVSSKTINAIVIRVYDDKALSRNSKPNTKERKSKNYKLSEIEGLDTRLLQQHKKLLVYVLNNDVLTEKKIVDYKKRVSKLSNYEYIKISVPDEEDGDIITGG